VGVAQVSLVGAAVAGRRSMFTDASTPAVPPPAAPSTKKYSPAGSERARHTEGKPSTQSRTSGLAGLSMDAQVFWGWRYSSAEPPGWFSAVTTRSRGSVSARRSTTSRWAGRLPEQRRA
jgi:hypothetical protein